jgi:uncharacterized membrane protein
MAKTEEKTEGSKSFFDGLDRPAIVEAIKRAESKSLGEIRVHLHHGAVNDAKAEGEKVFLKLGMDKTIRGTGCLVFIAPDSRAFAVIGGSGIHEKVGDGFWAEARDAAQAHFAEGRFTEGIVAAVDRLGDALGSHFPKAGIADTNELPDEVSED